MCGSRDFPGSGLGAKKRRANPPPMSIFANGAVIKAVDGDMTKCVSTVTLDERSERERERERRNIELSRTSNPSKLGLAFWRVLTRRGTGSATAVTRRRTNTMPQGGGLHLHWLPCPVIYGGGQCDGYEPDYLVPQWLYLHLSSLRTECECALGSEW